MSADFVIAFQDEAAYMLLTLEGVPTVAPGLVVVHASGPGRATVEAARLVAELETVLLASGPTTRVTRTLESASDPSSLSAFGEPERQKLLIVVVDGAGMNDETWLEAWLPEQPDRSVLTVIESGMSPTALLRSARLQEINAQFWTVSVTEAMPAVLSLSGLALEDQRIFISYRRLEAQPLAEQLFDALIHEGLDVFLDRFSIHPGLNFQQRLTQELADKSMVLLLESAYIEESHWTDHEIQFTKRYQLGLLALTMPDRKDGLKTVDADQRIPLKTADFRMASPDKVENPEFRTKKKLPAEYSQWGALTEAKLKDVVQAVKSVHDQALFRRRRFLRSNVEATLLKEGLTPNTVDTDGLMRVKAGGSEYALWLTTRPPELEDFRTTHGRMQIPPGTKGVVIGPTSALEPARTDRLDWLKGVCKVACIDQDDIATAAHLMKVGRL